MKTLIINGSPRKNGDTVTMINELKKHLHGEIITVNTYYDNIKPCTDCRYCLTHSKCLINDYMQEIYLLLGEADNIVIASPIYFSQLTGPLLSFASRLQFMWVSRYMRKDKNIKQTEKNGIIMLTGGGDGSAEPAKNMAEILIHQMNGNVISTICSLNTNNIPASEDAQMLKEIEKTAKLLNAKVI